MIKSYRTKKKKKRKPQKNPPKLVPLPCNIFFLDSIHSSMTIILLHVNETSRLREYVKEMGRYSWDHHSWSGLANFNQSIITEGYC